MKSNHTIVPKKLVFLLISDLFLRLKFYTKLKTKQLLNPCFPMIALA